MQIQISWLLQKPTDLDLHCLQKQGISSLSRTRAKYQGPVVQTSMKLLANVTLKFLSWNMANTLIFFAAKILVAFAYFCSKNISVLKNTLAKTVNGFVNNKHIKLTMLLTSRPSMLNVLFKYPKISSIKVSENMPYANCANSDQSSLINSCFHGERRKKYQ